jgi:hypothetical protein
LKNLRGQAGINVHQLCGLGHCSRAGFFPAFAITCRA